MRKIVILGAGVMGSALSVPAADNGHQVTLIGTHLDEDIIDSLQGDRYHPSLDARLPDSVQCLQLSQLNSEHVEEADFFVIGVSSAGMEWAVEQITRAGKPVRNLSLITKGLESNAELPALTYAESLPQILNSSPASGCGPLIGIGGPCIARELALRQPTAVVFGSTDANACADFAETLQTDYYRIKQSADVVGIEACAPLKNFFAIGVSATIGKFSLQKDGSNQTAKNPTAASFNQAVIEMAALSQWLGGKAATAYDLAGMGDLHVTVGGGRNSRLGICLGQGMTIEEAMGGPLKGQTVEGIDTGRRLAPGLHAALTSGSLRSQDFPLTLAILDSIENNSLFEFCHNRY